MSPSHLLLLCIGGLIPAFLAQEMPCTPQEVPETVINCDSIDSVFLSCACNNYKSSILELMGSVACIIPGLDFPTSPPPYTPTTPPVSPTGVINMTGSSPTVQTSPIVTSYSSQPQRGGGFGLQAFFNQQLSDTIKNVTAKLGEEAFDKLCEGLPALQQCVTSGYKQSTKPIDVALRTFFNFDNLEAVLTSVCNLKSEIFGNLDCVTDAALPMGACVEMALTGPFLSQAAPDMMSGDLDLSLYCPLAGDITRCLSIQAKTCSPRLGTTIRNILPDILSPDCNTLADAGADNPIMNTPLMCSLSSLPKTLGIIDDFGSGTPTAAQINSLIGDLIDIYCGELSSILTCLHDELPSSTNSMDRFIRTIVDVNQFSYADTLSQYICQPTGVQAIKDALPCLMTKESEIGICFRSEQGNFNLNFSTIGLDAARDRMTYCGPIQSVMTCSINTVLATCDANLAAKSHDIYLSLMRTDCNGARNGTLEGLIQAQRQDTTTPINAATTLVKQSIPTLAILIMMLFLLL